MPRENESSGADNDIKDLDRDQECKRLFRYPLCAMYDVQGG